MADEVEIRLTRDQAKWLRGVCRKIDDRYDDGHARPVVELLSSALEERVVSRRGPGDAQWADVA